MKTSCSTGQQLFQPKGRMEQLCFNSFGSASSPVSLLGSCVKWWKMKGLGTKQIGLRMALPLTDYVTLSRKHNDLPGPGTGYAGVDWW